MVIRSCLTIVFDGSFYRAILECHVGEDYSVASVILGSSEPKTSLILKLVNNDYQRFHFHHVTDKTQKIFKRVNPKRAQRLANKAMKYQGISTKAQNALQKQFEEKKKVRKAKHSAEKRLINNLRYQKRVAKRREKHRGH
ncbi:YjdF family protein [Limosilactobacillus reuteri]|uniref:YjdF family protein n=1 Tax=Limosilactobacillus reuteri TaxID=1598 RepID=UPI001E607F88|nr:YjdF family protein [Limosilactobacillus reuteri]MCC4381312.1 YjdF family protein [Limosilactobacillus reuteri]